jgi:uncharacterized protein (TIGR03086 family)
MTPVDQTSQVELLARACTSTAKVLEGVTGEQLALPTPCSDWRVRDLIDHIVGAADFFADLAELGASPEGRDWPTYSDGDFAAAFAEQAGRAVAAFSAPGALERVMVLPTGPGPGSRCIQVATGEIFIHGWDLATATGQALPAAQAGVADALLSSQWPSLCAEVRNADHTVFAPEVPVPLDAPALDRLAGFLGRDPNWSPGP